MKKSGREFEEAVFAFVKALDPTADVKFDHKVPDRDTGKPRQCDVWVNAKIGGHWPIAVLVSCKDHSRKLNSGHIDTFIGEVKSTGASTGVIYSKSGFTKPAIRKAKANGLSCCQLFQNQPAELPVKLWFEFFACSQRMGLFLLSKPMSGLKTWNDIFDISLHDGRTVLGVIDKAFHKLETEAIEESKKKGQFPNDLATDIEFHCSDSCNDKLILRVQLAWKKYRGKVEASLLDGSYCFSNDSFYGTQAYPTIDMKEFHPGNGWVEILEKNFNPPKNSIIAIRYHPNAGEILREELGPKVIE